MIVESEVGGPPRRPRVPGASGGLGGLPKFIGWLLLIPILAVGGFAYVWMIQRVEVGPDELLVLVRKIGQELPAKADDQVVLYPGLLRELGEPEGSSRFQGIVYETLPPGRYFFDPLVWDREIIHPTDIKQDEAGVLIRKYGKPMPEGATVAPEKSDIRGPVAGWLKPGRYNLNTFAYEVRRIKPVVIPAGHVGVQTLYSGNPPANANQYVVVEGERGVQPEVLPPGLHYNNPYERRIDVIDVRSHTLDLRGDEAIEFPSNDGFDILIEGTVEYAVGQNRAPYVLVAIGDHNEVVNRIILPYMKSLARIEGSKLLARDFISGEKRTAFQTTVFEQLRKQCYDQGIEIRAALIRRIVAPEEIAQPISDRQLAEQQIAQYHSEISVAASEAKLVEQEEMSKQNQAIGEANREMVTVVKEAEQNKAVSVTQARRKLEVARLNLQAAKETAAALLSRGQAEAEVKTLDYQAKARPLAEAVNAFGDGESYAQFFFYQKLAPAMKNVLDSTDGPFADIFRALSGKSPDGAMPSKPKVQPAARESAATTGGAQ